MQVVRIVTALFAILLLALFAGLAWLYYTAHRNPDAWFASRAVSVAEVREVPRALGTRHVAADVSLATDAGFDVQLRVLRPAAASGRLPVLLLLGGERTGADAVELFSSVTDFAVVAIDYPYDGPLSTRSLGATLAALPTLRRALRNTVPAIWLATDWVAVQEWADSARIALSGVSLGVPFATAAAARDGCPAALLLVHGAADNGVWLEHNLARRFSLGPLLPVIATLADWALYGPLHDTDRDVARIAPRPVIIVGASSDERTPRTQTESLYAAARQPKRLLWTEGRHVDPDRSDVVDTLLQLARRELMRLPTQSAGAIKESCSAR